MSWIITGEVGEFLAEAGDFLRAEPARNSVLLTVTENLRVQAAAQSPPAAPDTRTPGPDQPLFGWWRPSARPDPHAAVFLHTPEFPVNLSFMSPPAAAELARDLAAAGRRLTGVHAGQEAADAFAAAWRDRTGDIVAVHRLMRLFRLGELIRPEPGPEGAARLAVRRDRDLLTEWFDAFVRDVGDPPRQDHGTAVDQRLGYGGLALWEVSGTPVSMAGVTRSVAGMVRVGSVYTPPALRGRGYAGAVTAAVSRAARDAGVREVVLFTDLANPTSNALYQRLGYRPVEDRVTFSFERARHALGFTGERTRGLRPAGRR
jgi:RimJ/RimL family protein N-acetyltransferase